MPLMINPVLQNLDIWQMILLKRFLARWAYVHRYLRWTDEDMIQEICDKSVDECHLCMDEIEKGKSYCYSCLKGMYGTRERSHYHLY